MLTEIALRYLDEIIWVLTALLTEKLNVESEPATFPNVDGGETSDYWRWSPVTSLSTRTKIILIITELRGLGSEYARYNRRITHECVCLQAMRDACALGEVCITSGSGGANPEHNRRTYQYLCTYSAGSALLKGSDRRPFQCFFVDPSHVSV